MRNIKVCENFFVSINAKGSNLESKDGKLFSYSTCIAEWDYSIHKLYLNNTKYSVTTSKHQCYLNIILSGKVHEQYVINLDNVPRGTQSLKYYAERQR